ncbi:hypothetical protein [Halorientalis litorea]|uniref:hypothetical protein n=1 Tax=Halorientalis litorea TaxID=2931977 RepID=UPI001FF247C8|nr:hypothetical protein [Halorientalis litorea]
MNLTLSLSDDERRVAAIAAWVGCVVGVLLGAALVPNELFRPELLRVSERGTAFTPLVPLSITHVVGLALAGFLVALYRPGEGDDCDEPEGSA